MADVSAKAKKAGALAARRAQALHQACELVIEHGFQPLAADVVLGRTVDPVADRHIVSGDGLGDGAGGFSGVEEPAGHFLAGANFGKGAELAGVQIDLQRFWPRAAGFFRHLLMVRQPAVLLRLRVTRLGNWLGRNLATKSTERWESNWAGRNACETRAGLERPLANLYMNRMLKGFRQTRREEQFRVRIVYYA